MGYVCTVRDNFRIRGYWGDSITKKEITSVWLPGAEIGVEFDWRPSWAHNCWKAWQRLELQMELVGQGDLWEMKSWTRVREHVGVEAKEVWFTLKPPSSLVFYWAQGKEMICPSTIDTQSLNFHISSCKLARGTGWCHQIYNCSLARDSRSFTAWDRLTKNLAKNNRKSSQLWMLP